MDQWANVVTASIGIASGSAIVLEVLGVLLIKPAVEGLLKQGERRLLDSQERRGVIDSKQRQEEERIREQERKEKE